jgi:hypothetical protein
MSGGPSPGVSAIEVFKSAGIVAEKAQSDHRYRLVSLSPLTLGTKIASIAGMEASLAGGDYLIHIKSEGVSVCGKIC